MVFKARVWGVAREIEEDSIYLEAKLLQTHPISGTKALNSRMEMTYYILENVKRQSVVINRRNQSPCIISSPSLDFDWKQAKL